MIVFLLTAEHTYTHNALAGADPRVSIKVLTYSRLAKLSAVPRATYIFTDLDRLSTQMLKFAAQRYRQFRDLGLTVLNDPARFRSRSGLLRALYLKGTNRFSAYRVEDGVSPARWPVFLRTEGDHAGPMPELYHSPAELEDGIAHAIAEGTPLSRLLVVEFMAEPVREGLFRKFSVFRIGCNSFAHICGHDSQWIAKDGQLGIATGELYEEEFQIVRDNPYGPCLAPVFDLAGIEYGRADFGLVGGQVQVYEINSNPTLEFGSDTHPFAVRLESYRVFKENYFSALSAVDTPDPPKEVLIAIRWSA